MNIYMLRDYREIIKLVINTRKRIDKKINFQALAEFSRIPKSYISKVLGGNASLNQDQMFAICAYFKFDHDECYYLELLLEYDRSASHHRRKYLKAKIDDMQLQKQEISKNLNLSQKVIRDSLYFDYYLDPFNQIIHMAMRISRFAKDPFLIGPLLAIDEFTIRKCLATLEKLGIIELTTKGCVVKETNFHLSRDSDLFKSWLANLRLLSLNRAVRLQHQKHNKSVSVIFSADKNALEKIYNKFLEYLKKCESIIGNCEDQNVYQLNFDLLEWL